MGSTKNKTELLGKLFHPIHSATAQHILLHILCPFFPLCFMSVKGLHWKKGKIDKKGERERKNSWKVGERETRRVSFKKVMNNFD